MLIAVTGGIAAGKSTVVKLLGEKLSYETISIDGIVDEIYKQLSDNPDIWWSIRVDTLRSELLKYFEDDISKEHIAKACVANPSLLPIVEQLFMPFVKRRLTDYLISRENLIVEFPLLVEMGDPARFDLVINVEADKHLRYTRALSRTGMTDEKFNLITSKQTSDIKRREIADYTFMNGCPVDLEHHTDVISVLVKTNRKKTGIISGSFDPITNGHLHLIQKGLELLDEVVVIIASNANKKSMFDLEERKNLVMQAIKNVRLNAHVLVLPSDELVVSMAKTLDARYIVRGLRNGTDFEYEHQIDLVQTKIAPLVKTVYFITPRELTEVSSSLVKSVVGLKGWKKIAEPYVPPCVLKALEEKANR